MVNCDRCGKKISLLQRKYSYENEAGINRLNYCKDCNEKLIEEKKRKERERKERERERKKLLKKLKEDKLIIKFVEKHNLLCLTLKDKDLCAYSNTLKKFQYLKMNLANSGLAFHSYEREIYTNFIKVFCEGEITEFVNELSSNLNEIKIYSNFLNHQDYSSTIEGLSDGFFISDKVLNIKLFVNDFLGFFESDDSLKTFTNFLEIISKKYSDLDIKNLFSALNTLAKESTFDTLSLIVIKLKTKEEVFDLVIDKYEDFLKKELEELRIWIKETIAMLLNYSHKKGLFDYEDLESFQEEIRKYKIKGY